jgi:hypothetical protein
MSVMCGVLSLDGTGLDAVRIVLAVNDRQFWGVLDCMSVMCGVLSLDGTGLDAVRIVLAVNDRQFWGVLQGILCLLF